jgi:hypothetical protein
VSVGGKTAERKACLPAGRRAVFPKKEGRKIFWVTRGSALRRAAQDGLNIDTRLVIHGIVNPAQATKGNLAAGPKKLLWSQSKEAKGGRSGKARKK